MQYMAVVDEAEIIFVDSQYKHWIEVAWQRFRPRARKALDEPVVYEAVFYNPDGSDVQRRLQSEFHRALALLSERRRPDAPAHVLPMSGRNPVRN